MVLEDENTWDGILAVTIFVLRATVHITSLYTPTQLAFGRDSILNVRHEANWKLIKEKKQKLINLGNELENKKRLNHEYKIGEKVVLKNALKIKFNKDAYVGPYIITDV